MGDGAHDPPIDRGKMNADGVEMEDQQDMSGNDTEIAEEVGASLGVPQEAENEIEESQEATGHQANDPLYVQKRLKQQKRAHDREMREMQARMAELQAQMSSPQQQQSFDANPYAQPQGGQGVDETISKAVSFALQQKEQEERKAKAAEAAQSISKHYSELQRHLDHVSEKYDDFDDVVRSDTAPFTATMRDAALMLPKKGAGSAGEVLYKLGKNPEELARISKLYPHEQAAELVALSHALISGGEQKGNHSRPLGQVKANPVVNSAGITEKTPVSTIRDRMKKGTFK